MSADTWFLPSTPSSPPRRPPGGSWRRPGSSSATCRPAWPGWRRRRSCIDGFARLTAIFDSTTLDPVAREVVIMTMATRNGCHICVAMHTARLTALGRRPGPHRGAARRRRRCPIERLDAVRVFTLRVLDTAGDVGDEALRDFLASGYTSQNALEVVLGIGTYTMSTLANRLTGAPVDDQLRAFA